MPTKEKIICRTPTLGKRPTRIDRWKYDAVRAAILKAVPRRGEGIEFRELPKLVARLLPKDDLKRLGSVKWYTTVVKLAMEVDGELKRVPDVSPQRLLRR